jgi:hypothetical protein
MPADARQRSNGGYEGDLSLGVRQWHVSFELLHDSVDHSVNV